MEDISTVVKVLSDVITQHAIFTIGFLLIFGYFLGKSVTMIKLPQITGFILAGLLIGSFTGGHPGREFNTSLHVITDIAIGFLALTIGSEFSLKKLKKIGKKIFTITLFQFLFTFVIVTIGVYLLGFAIPFAIILGITACASAPAIIVAEVQHLRVHGKFVDYLFATVALIDAVSIMIFGIAFVVLTNYLNLIDPGRYFFLSSVTEIIFSILIGAVSGYLIHSLTRQKKNSGELLIITLSLVFLNTGVSLALHLSPILLNIIAGTVLINLSNKNIRLLRNLEPLSPPIYALFFVIAGIEFNPEILTQPDILLVALGYIILRGLGKYFGVLYGSKLCKAPAEIGRYLGHCTYSQAGIALGFVLMAQTSPAISALPVDSIHHKIFTKMVSIILVSIFVNELIGPIFAKFAIVRGNQMEE